MKLEKILVKKFRHMENVEILFGERLTAISGQNGTGKSTVLGLVGQIFDFKGKETTKNHQPFASKYSEIFRFCSTHDKKKTHEYIATINDDGKIITKEAKSRFIKGEGISGRFRIDIGDRHKPKDRAIDFPVIYLGLKRLLPLAQEKEDSIKVNPLKLSNQEKSFFNKYAKEILILLDQTINPQDIKSPNKEFFAMETDEYSNLGNSAGQDNLGQLLTAILSFRELKEKNGKYRGGILLIDEIDAALYAGSQINLIKKLYKFSIDYNLQIIFTTHSLEILELLNEKEDWNTKINFFETKNRKVKNILNPALSEIRDKILVQTKRGEKIEKISILCEDEITELWCKNLLNGTQIKKKVEIKKVPIGASTLKELAQKKHPAFKKMIFVLDGDYSENKDYKNLPRTLFLPGTVFPEKVLYDYFFSLSDEDDYWDNEEHFNKQVCFNNFVDLKRKSDIKSWFKANKSNFGNSLSKPLKRWKKDNEAIAKLFQDNFAKALKKILK